MLDTFFTGARVYLLAEKILIHALRVLDFDFNDHRIIHSCVLVWILLVVVHRFVPIVMTTPELDNLFWRVGLKDL